jgi:hypothetical protein
MRIKPPTLSGVALGAVVVLIVTATGATAAALITSADIKDGTIKSVDINDGEVKSADINGGAVASSELKDGEVKSADINGGAVASSELKDNSVASADILDGTLTLTDINNATEQELRAGIPTVVSDLAGLFTPLNTAVTMTPDGVQFGPYPNGGLDGGSLEYSGLNGQPLSAVENLAYYARFIADNDAGTVSAPYLRVRTEAGDAEHDIIFTPGPPYQTDPDAAEGPFHEWVATSGKWRYDDLPGDCTGQYGCGAPLSEVIADHGTEPIIGIRITTGFGGAAINLTVLLRWWQINGQTFTFGG